MNLGLPFHVSPLSCIIAFDALKIPIKGIEEIINNSNVQTGKVRCCRISDPPCATFCLGIYGVLCSDEACPVFQTCELHGKEEFLKKINRAAETILIVFSKRNIDLAFKFFSYSFPLFHPHGHPWRSSDPQYLLSRAIVLNLGGTIKPQYLKILRFALESQRFWCNWSGMCSGHWVIQNASNDSKAWPGNGTNGHWLQALLCPVHPTDHLFRFSLIAIATASSPRAYEKYMSLPLPPLFSILSVGISRYAFWNGW